MRTLSAGTLAALALAAASAMAQEPAPAAPPPAPDAAKTAPRVDQYGDPLPAGAIARIGTARFRHGAPVLACAASPDGAMVMTLGGDQVVRCWEVAAGREVAAFGMPEIPWTPAMAVLPNGYELAVSGQRHSVKIWDLKRGRVSRIVRHGDDGRHDHEPAHLAAVSPDGSAMAITCACDQAHVLDLVQGRVSWSIGKQEFGHNTLAVSNGGLRVITVEHGGRAWMIAADKPDLRVPLAGGQRVEAVAISGDATWIATYIMPHAVHIWRGGDGARVTTIQTGFIPPGRPHSMCFGRDGTLVVVAAGGALYRLSPPTFEPGGRYGLWSTDPTTVGVAADGKAVVAGDESGAVQVWTEPGAYPLGPTRISATTFDDVAFSPDGGRLAIAGTPMSVWDARTGTSIATCGPETEAGLYVAWLPGDRGLICGRGQGLAESWVAGQARPSAMFQGHEGALRGLVVSRDGGTLVTLGAEGTAAVWDTATGKERRRITVEPAGSALAFGSDEARLLIGFVDGAVRAFMLDGEASAAQWPGHRGEVSKIVVGRNGQWVATSGADGDVLVREAATGDVKARLTMRPPRQRPGEDDPREADASPHPPAIASSPDGQFLAVAAGDGTARIYRVPSGDLLGRWCGHRGAVLCVAFSPDGKQLATAGMDGTAVVWDLTAPPDRPRTPGAYPDGVPIAPPVLAVDEVAVVDAARVDGDYRSLADVAQFEQERVVLAHGSFQRWFAVHGPAEGRPPQEGNYAVEGDVVRLHLPDGEVSERILDTVNGQRVLWQRTGLELWRAERRIHPYCVLVHSDAPWRGFDPDALPREWDLFDDAMRAQAKKEYDERFHDVAEPARALLRAETDQDPELTAYRAMQQAWRAKPSVALIRALVARLAEQDPYQSKTSFALQCLYEPIFGHPDERFPDAAATRAGLEVLIEAMDAAPDERAVTSCLEAFLGGLGGGELIVPRPGENMALSLSRKRTDDGIESSYGFAASAPLPVDPDGKRTPHQCFIAAAQAACRAKLPPAEPTPPTPPSAPAPPK